MKELEYFWVLQFENDRIIGQFRFDSGKEVLYNNAVKQGKVKRVGWLPFNEDFAKLVNKNSIYSRAVPINNKPHWFDVEGKDFQMFRKNYLKYNTNGFQKREIEYCIEINGEIYKVNNYG